MGGWGNSGVIFPATSTGGPETRMTAGMSRNRGALRTGIAGKGSTAQAAPTNAIGLAFIGLTRYTSSIGEVTEHFMDKLLAVTSALSDATRVRALFSLRGGELCLCQIIDLLGLSPSTVSKHMDLLHRAGLVRRRKEGRWHYFSLAGREALPLVRKALRWTLEALADEPSIKADARRLCCVRKKNMEEVVACYR